MARKRKSRTAAVRGIERARTINKLGLWAWRPAARTEPDRKKTASFKACRRKYWKDQTDD